VILKIVLPVYLQIEIFQKIVLVIKAILKIIQHKPVKLVTQIV
jgi:hypothetical protein